MKLRREFKESDEKIMQEVRNLGLRMELVIERKVDILIDLMTAQQQKNETQDKEIEKIKKEKERDSLRILNHEERIENLENHVNSEMMIHS